MRSEPFPEGSFFEPTDQDQGRGIHPEHKVPKQAPEEAGLLQKARSRKLDQVRKLAPSKVGVLKRAYGGNSLRAAVNANCLDCMGYEKGMVRDCSILSCPLHPYRPYQLKGSKGAVS